MPRHAYLALALLLSVTPGCLRSQFNLCPPTAPDPQCGFLDASVDAGADAADASVDAGTGAADASVAD